MVIFIPWDRIRKKSPKQIQVCHLVLHHHSLSSITIGTKVKKPEEKNPVPGDPQTFPIGAVPGTMTYHLEDPFDPLLKLN